MLSYAFLAVLVALCNFMCSLQMMMVTWPKLNVLQESGFCDLCMVNP
jgi:hypothetical protein